MATIEKQKGNLYSSGGTGTSTPNVNLGQRYRDGINCLASIPPVATKAGHSEVLLKRMDEIISRLAEAEKALGKQIDYILPPRAQISGNPAEGGPKTAPDRFVGILEERIDRLEDLTGKLWRLVANLEDF